MVTPALFYPSMAERQTQSTSGGFRRFSLDSSDGDALQFSLAIDMQYCLSLKQRRKKKPKRQQRVIKETTKRHQRDIKETQRGNESLSVIICLWFCFVCVVRVNRCCVLVGNSYCPLPLDFRQVVAVNILVRVTFWRRGSCGRRWCVVQC